MSKKVETKEPKAAATILGISPPVAGWHLGPQGVHLCITGVSGGTWEPMFNGVVLAQQAVPLA